MKALTTSTSRRIALAMICLLLLFGGSSNGAAFEILEMAPAYGSHEAYDWGSGATSWARVKTDEPIHHVNWYVNYVLESGDTFPLVPGTTTAYFGYEFTGTLTGEKYDVRAEI